MPANRDHYIQVDKDLMDDPLLLCAAKNLAARNELCWNGEHLTDDESLCIARARYVCALLRLWCYADTYIRDDDTIPMGSWEVDHYVGLTGFCDLTPPQWLEVIDDNTVRLPQYCEKNNVVSRRKRRKENADRMKRNRDAARALHMDDTCDERAPHVQRNTNTNTKKEKGSKDPQKKAPRDDRKRQTRLFEAELTPGLNRDAWQRWLQYRIELRKPLPTASLHLAAEAMARLGSHAEQLDAVTFTIGQGWQGLQARKAQPAATPRAWSTRPTQESALAAIDAANRDSEDNQGDGFIRIADV
jgi:hypothetical protein